MNGWAVAAGIWSLALVWFGYGLAALCARRRRKP
jgi:uncharacterized membrane protein